MREFLTDKNFINTKILLVVRIILILALLIFFLPLFILPFFNHPFADDYFSGYQLNNRGFINYQSFIYFNWSGRFASTFVWSLFEHKGFLYTHYYSFSLLALILNFASIFFLLNTTSKYVLAENLNFPKRLLLSSLVLALEICSIPQLSTFLFWFSSVIPYCFPIISTQLEIAVFILLYNSGKRSIQFWLSCLLSIFIFITNGFNEFFIVVQAMFIAIVIFFKWYKKIPSFFILLMILAFLSSSIVVLFAPGNYVRRNEINSKNLVVYMVSILYGGLETLWYIFKNPSFWFGGSLIFIYANKVKTKWQSSFLLKKLYPNKWLLPFSILSFLLGLVALPAIAFKGGIIPDRYLNAVICCILLLLISSFFIIGISSKLKTPLIQTSTKKIYLYSLLIIVILSNSYISDVYKSLAIAPIYNVVLNKREAILKQAAATNKVAIVDNYNGAISKLLKTKYRSSTITFKQLIQQKPPLLFFEDDLADDYSIDVLKKYYMLDSIRINRDSTLH